MDVRGMPKRRTYTTRGCTAFEAVRQPRAKPHAQTRWTCQPRTSKRVPRIELVVAALKSSFACLIPETAGAAAPVLLPCKCIALSCLASDFMEDGLDDVAIRARQHLPEHRAGDLDKKRVPLAAFSLVG